MNRPLLTFLRLPGPKNQTKVVSMNLALIGSRALQVIVYLCLVIFCANLLVSGVPKNATSRRAPSRPKLACVDDLPLSAEEVRDFDWNVSPELQQNLIAETQVLCSPVSLYQISSIPNLHETELVTFELNGRQYAVAIEGMLNPENAVVSFSDAKDRVLVGYNSFKNVACVYVIRNNVDALPIGVVGITADHELLLKIDGECFESTKEWPYEKLPYDRQKLSKWKANNPNSQFCPCGLADF